VLALLGLVAIVSAGCILPVPIPVGGGGGHHHGGGYHRGHRGGGW
jgi:hypothetical protein